MWYALQVNTGSEHTAAEQIRRHVNAALFSEVFWPQFETLTKLRGRRVRVVRPLFPGYLIVSTDDAAGLQAALRGVPEFCRLCGMGGVPVPLGKEEAQVLVAFTRPGERVVPMSRAVKEGEKVTVVEGPLAGHEGLIKSINRHKCEATLEMSLGNVKVRTRLGLAVLGDVDSDSPEVVAARLRRRASDLARDAA